MRVVQLEIEGFRGIQTGKVRFGEHVVLLGGNDVGKTAVVDALALLLGRRKLVRDLWEHDFFGSSPGPAARINLRATISNLETEDIGKLPLWFAGNAATPVWWDNTCGELQLSKTSQHSELGFQIGFCARFDHELAEVESLRYFADGDGDAFQEPSLRTLKPRHLKALAFYLLPSARTWDRVISFSSDLFRRVLQLEEALPADALLELRDWLRDPKQRLEEHENLKPILSRVESELAAYAGVDTQLSFLPTAGDTDAVLRALTPHLTGRAGLPIPLGKHGSGVVSLQTLALLLEVGRARRQQGEQFMLVAEEPELHLHPGHHRRLVAKMRGVSTQTIVTTHSPEIAAYYHPSEIVVLHNVKGTLTASKFEATPDPNALMRLHTIYRADVCEALMHRLVVIPEGLTEFRWYRALRGACVTAEGWSSPTAAHADALALGLLPTQDSKVATTYEHFSKFGLQMLPLVDGDAAGNEYVKELLALPNPPRDIARLSTGLNLERVLAHLLEPAPESVDGWQKLSKLLGAEVSDRVTLAQALEAKKKHWSTHDALVEHVASEAFVARKVLRFLHGLACVTTTKGDASLDWRKSVNAAAPVTTLWTWSPPAQGDPRA